LADTLSGNTRGVLLARDGRTPGSGQNERQEDHMNDREKESGGFESMGEKVGGLAGRMAGKAGDAAVDATGAIFNSMAAMLGSWWSGDEAQRAAKSFGEDDDRACRDHYSSVQSTGGTRSASDYT